VTRALPLLLTVCVTCACGVSPAVPDDVARPSVIGIVTDITQQRDGVLVGFEGGGTHLVPIGAAELTGTIEEGRLLIYGDEPRPNGPSPWFAAVRGDPSGCFRVPVNGEIRDNRLALSLGFSVALSEDWDEAGESFVEAPPVGFCLNERGEAVRTD
jgi:hypothetical protein